MSRHERERPPTPYVSDDRDSAVDPDLRSGSTDDREPVWTPAPEGDHPTWEAPLGRRGAFPQQLPRKRRHISRWVFLAVQILFLVWIITGVSSSSTKSCNNLVGQALTTCQSASHAGTAIGVGLVIGLWMAVDVILAITWLIFRKRA